MGGGETDGIGVTEGVGVADGVGGGVNFSWASS